MVHIFKPLHLRGEGVRMLLNPLALKLGGLMDEVMLGLS